MHSAAGAVAEDGDRCAPTSCSPPRRYWTRPVRRP